MPKIYKPTKINIRTATDLDENWLQQRIAEDPTILGLGNLDLKDKERIQPKAGRLDILLQDPETNRRYEVEVQLGSTDASHIIRTIEYWDIERKRYPQYEHCAVIVAEEITGRFMNVISLFNGFIPLIAIQLNAYKFGEEIALIPTTVLDEVSLGLDEEDEIKEPADRKFWIQKRGSEETIGIADELIGVINEFAEGYKLNYTKHHIGLEKHGKSNNFVVMRPRRTALNLEIRVPFSEELQNKIEKSGIDMVGYEKRWGGFFKLRLFKQDVSKNHKLLRELMEMAYRESSNSAYIDIM